MEKEVVYTCNGILLSHKKEWNLTICDNMDGPRGYHAKWNKLDRERQILYDFTYMWNFWKMNKHNKTETELKLQRTNHGWQREGGRGRKEIGD